MKKIILVIISSLYLTACNLDINKDPNYPDVVSPVLIFPAAQNSIASVLGDGMYNYAGFFAQYYDQMPEANQYNDISEYFFTEQTQLIDRSYRTLYAGALKDLDVIINDKTTTNADRYAATILRVLSFQVLVDNMDKTPYSEALKGNLNTAPRWDDGKAVYRALLDELDLAEAAVGNSTMTCSDLLLSKDIDQWKGFADALRLRMYLKFVDAGVDPVSYTDMIKTLITNSTFFQGDVKFDVYKDEVDRRNPWYAANKINLPPNHVASYPIISYLKLTNDPRIEYNFVRATKNGQFEGELPGSKIQLSSKKNADYSFLRYYASKPVYFFTQSELQFLLAECYLRFMTDDVKAQAAYEAAIDADFSAREISNPNVMYGSGGSVAWSTASDNTAKLNLIYMQKWVALCYMDHIEAWSEIRRTDVPKLSDKSAAEINANPSLYTAGDLIAPMRNGLGDGVMVKRMFFPLSARQLNSNTPNSVPLSAPIWWDVK